MQTTEFLFGVPPIHNREMSRVVHLSLFLFLQIVINQSMEVLLGLQYYCMFSV